jgi:hypothetical protein
LLYQHFRKGAIAASVEQHLPATDQRADVYIETAERYALEFQQANNSVARWNERHILYQRQHIHDIWFLGQVRYHERQIGPISSYDPLPVPRDVYGAASGSFQARELEKAVLAVEPALYFLNPETGILTILLVKGVQGNTTRAYRYQLLLSACALRNGKLWTPLDPLLDEYHRYLAERGEA